jgi:hypothetical protein
MVEDGAEPETGVTHAHDLVKADRRQAPPWVVDAEFRVVPPVWRMWRALRDNWWALGPYLAYCTGLWGLAALVAWLIDHGRRG